MPPDGIRTLNSSKQATAAPRLIHFRPIGFLANWIHFLNLCVLTELQICLMHKPVYQCIKINQGYNLFRKIAASVTARKQNPSFLGAFAKLQTATLSFLMSVHLSVRPLGTSRLSLDEFSWNLIFDYFSKICRENSGFIQVWQEKRVLYMQTNINLWSYLVEFFVEWEMFQTNVWRKSKHTFYVPQLFRKLFSLRYYVEKYLEPDRP